MLVTNQILSVLKDSMEKIDKQVELSPLERTGADYQDFLNRKNTLSDEKDFIELAKKFREMEGYKDSETLADECGNLAIKAKYNNLINLMKKASKEEECQELAEQFNNMKGYNNTVELANECDKKYHALKKRREEQERIAREDRLKERKAFWQDVAAIASGHHTVCLKSNGTVGAVGKNDDGQCNVSNWRNIVAIAVGTNRTVGLKSDGTVVAVGKMDREKVHA